MHKFEVGQLYHPDRRQWPEAIQYTYDQNGHSLDLFFPSPSDQEIAAVKAAGKEFALTIYQGVIFLLYRLPGNPQWSDYPFSWWLIPAERRAKPSLTGRAELLSITLVDADTGIIQALVACNWSRDFSQAINDAIAKQSRTAFDPAKHAKLIESAYRKWPDTNAMAADAVARCVGGAEVDYDTPLRTLPADMGRIADVASAAGVVAAEVEAVSAEDAYAYMAGFPDPRILETCQDNPALYWRAIGRLYLDDPDFGPVVAIDDLVYDGNIGLHGKDW